MSLLGPYYFELNGLIKIKIYADFLNCIQNCISFIILKILLNIRLTYFHYGHLMQSVITYLIIYYLSNSLSWWTDIFLHSLKIYSAFLFKAEHLQRAKAYRRPIKKTRHMFIFIFKTMAKFQWINSFLNVFLKFPIYVFLMFPTN